MVRETWPWGHKEDIIKNTCKKGRDVNYISKKIKIKRSTADFSSETMKNDIFKMLKEKKKDQLLSTLYQAKLSFQAKETLRHSLPNEQNQRESYMARRPVIQEIPKTVL